MNQTGKGILWGTGISLILLLSLSFIAAAFIYYTSLNQQTLAVVAIVIDAIALFAGGLMAGKKAGAKGMIMGLSVAIIILAMR